MAATEEHSGLGGVQEQDFICTHCRGRNVKVKSEVKVMRQEATEYTRPLGTQSRIVS